MKEANQDRKICRTKERNNEGQNDRKKERDKERGGLVVRSTVCSQDKYGFAFRVNVCRKIGIWSVEA